MMHNIDKDFQFQLFLIYAECKVATIIAYRAAGNISTYNVTNTVNVTDIICKQFFNMSYNNDGLLYISKYITDKVIEIACPRAYAIKRSQEVKYVLEESFREILKLDSEIYSIYNIAVDVKCEISKISIIDNLLSINTHSLIPIIKV